MEKPYCQECTPHLYRTHWTVLVTTFQSTLFSLTTNEHLVWTFSDAWIWRENGRGLGWWWVVLVVFEEPWVWLGSTGLEKEGVKIHFSLVSLQHRLRLVSVSRGAQCEVNYCEVKYFCRKILDNKLDPKYPRRTSIAVSVNTVKFMNPTTNLLL